MPDAIWIDGDDGLRKLARVLEASERIGLDTEFLRERTFFPKLCLLQVAAGGSIWCVDTLLLADLDPLAAALTRAGALKILHAARQDLEAVYLAARRIVSPVFDTQIAAGCVGLKPQIGYADLAKALLGVDIAKGQTRTDWSRRPLTREQLHYAAEDVWYLERIAQYLMERLDGLGRRHWVDEDCRALADPHCYEPDPARAWERLKGLAQLEPAPRTRAKAIAVWRERLARERNLPRAWILPDTAIFAVAHAAPENRAALAAVPGVAANFNDGFAASLLETLGAEPRDASPAGDPARALRPTPEQKALIDRLARIVDDRAAELGVSAEILAPRGELKALALGAQASDALQGWRRDEIGTRLLAALDRPTDAQASFPSTTR